MAKDTAAVLLELQQQLQAVHTTVSEFAQRYVQDDASASVFVDALNLEDLASVYAQQDRLIAATQAENQTAQTENATLENIALLCKALRKPQDKVIKQLLDAISSAVKTQQLSKNKDWKDLNLKDALDRLKALQQQLSGNPDEGDAGLLHDTDYFWKQAHWLQSRFPNGIYTDVEGLCKVVNQGDIEAKDWSLSPGRYVGVDAAIDDDFDYEERLNEIHIELAGLNEEAVALAGLIAENFQELSI